MNCFSSSGCDLSAYESEKITLQLGKESSHRDKSQKHPPRWSNTSSSCTFGLWSFICSDALAPLSCPVQLLEVVTPVSVSSMKSHLQPCLCSHSPKYPLKPSVKRDLNQDQEGCPRGGGVGLCPPHLALPPKQ